MDELQNKVDESLQQTLKRVCEPFDKASSEVEALHFDISIPYSQLDLFKVV